jgi:hypothetical protein
VDRPTDEPPERDGNAANPSGVPEAPPTLPSRTAFLLAFLSILLAGLFGGIIGYGLGDISADGGGGLEPALWALVGAIIAGGGVGIVAVLVLRAQAEWRHTPPPHLPHPPTDAAGEDPPDDA